MKVSARNLPLIIVLVITVVVSAVLIYLVVIKHSEVSETNSKIEEYKKILNNANRKKPAPVTENFRNMNADAERLDRKTYQVQRRFGKYYRKALIHFANTIGISGDELKKEFAKYYQTLSDDLKADIAGTTEKSKLDTFLTKPDDPARLEKEIAEFGAFLNESRVLKNFAEYYNELPKEKKGLITGGIQDKKLLQEFFQKEKYNPALLKTAIGNFMKDVQAMTVETVNEGNVHEFILAALGLPRTAFVTYYKGILKRLQNQMFLKKLFPYAESIKVVEDLTFGADFQPIQRQIPQVIRQIMLREDFFQRAKDAKLEEFRSIRELTPYLNGKKENDDYLCFSYEIEVIGRMDQLRDFINRLQNAYEDNIVYRIRDIQIQKNDPENVADLTARDTKDPGILLAEKFQMADFVPQNTEENLLAASYGKAAVGRSKLIKMRINVDTLLYVADQLERVDLSRK